MLEVCEHHNPFTISSDFACSRRSERGNTSYVPTAKTSKVVSVSDWVESVSE